MIKKLKASAGYMFFILVYAVLGFFLGINMGKVIINPVKLFFYAFSIILFYILHIIIHEAGHGLFGYLTGYKLLSYRIFSFMWVRQNNGKITFRRFKVPGTLGQCLMIPPKFQQDKFPFKLYLMGGVLANLISSLMVGLLFVPKSIPAILFVLIGLFSAFTNAFPIGFNDGMSYKIASSSPEQLYLFFIQLETNSRLFKGETYQDMPEKYFDTVPEIPEKTYFNDGQKLLQIGLAFDKQQWSDFRIKLENLWEKRENLVSIYLIELKKELLFALCLQDPDDQRIPDIWQDKSIKNSLSQPMMGNRRIQAAYHYFILKEKQKAETLLNEAIALKDKAPNPGEAKMELRAITYLQNIIEQEKKSDN